MLAAPVFFVSVMAFSIPLGERRKEDLHEQNYCEKH